MNVKPNLAVSKKLLKLLMFALNSLDDFAPSTSSFEVLNDNKSVKPKLIAILGITKQLIPKPAFAPNPFVLGTSIVFVPSLIFPSAYA